jgi:cytochrome c5
MRAVTTTVILVSLFASASSALRARQSAERPSVSTTERARLADDPDGSQMVQTYCAGCHNGVMRSPSDALLDRFDTATIAGSPDVWSRAYRQLQAGTMPPFGAPRPDRAASGKLLSSIELGLDQLGRAEPDTKYFPDYDVTLREAMAMETDLFIRSQLRDNHDPIALWTADYTFLNEPLARHYGISGVTGEQFRRVQLPTPERKGLLGQGSILMLTSRHQHSKDSVYTSPAARAVWVRMHFLGAPPPRPFPGAQPVKPDLPITPQTRTLPAEPCVKCHRNFFPLGYALEHFDPIGRWRTDDQAGPVDASGTFVDGTPTNGSVELRTALLPYSEAFRTTITEKLLIYAAAKSVSGSRPTPETLVRAQQVLHAAPTTRWSSLIAAIVRMKPLSAL